MRLTKYKLPSLHHSAKKKCDEFDFKKRHGNAKLDKETKRHGNAVLDIDLPYEQIDDEHIYEPIAGNDTPKQPKKPISDLAAKYLANANKDAPAACKKNGLTVESAKMKIKNADNFCNQKKRLSPHIYAPSTGDPTSAIRPQSIAYASPFYHELESGECSRISCMVADDLHETMLRDDNNLIEFFFFHLNKLYKHL